MHLRWLIFSVFYYDTGNPGSIQERNLNIDASSLIITLIHLSFLFNFVSCLTHRQWQNTTYIMSRETDDESTQWL